MDKARRRALRAVNHPQKNIAFVVKALIISLILSCLFLFIFFLGLIFGAPLVKWWREADLRQEQALAAVPTLEDEARLLNEAATYALFWERRASRLQKAAARFGWDERELAKAFRLIEAAGFRFQAVEIGYLGWDSNPEITYDILKHEVDELYSWLVIICDELGLVCRRGVTLDQAQFKSGQPPKPSRTAWMVVIFPGFVCEKEGKMI